MTHTERFAPSPTGPLHLGHAFSAITAHDRARAAGGRFLLRIEDIDPTRSRTHWEAQILDDLAWLGLAWDGEVLRQSTRMAAYRAALERLRDAGFLYACTCRRRDIDEALSAMQEGARHGPDGPVYPGTCRANRIRAGAALPQGVALRLDMERATDGLPPLPYRETGETEGTVTVVPPSLTVTAGDVVLGRRDHPVSYHLAVVVDDGFQGVTHVTRGADLGPATPVQVLLKRLLGLPTPVYHQHRLIRDETGRRLAKRDDARAIARFRDEDGATPDDIRERVGLPPRTLAPPTGRA